VLLCEIPILTSAHRLTPTGATGSSMNRTASIGFRVEPRVKKVALEAAKRERRTLSSLLEKMLIDFLLEHSLLDETNFRSGK
jgi:hypothetical protein